MMNKIIYLLIGPKSWCKLEEVSPNLSTNERSGFLPPNPFFSPDSKSRLALTCSEKGREKGGERDSVTTLKRRKVRPAPAGSCHSNSSCVREAVREEAPLPSDHRHFTLPGVPTPFSLFRSCCKSRTFNFNHTFEYSQLNLCLTCL